MSDPQPSKLKKKPARAEPLQPDLPGSGDDADGQASAGEDAPKRSDSEQAANDLQDPYEAALRRKNAQSDD
jgi:hypothetical protein